MDLNPHHLDCMCDQCEQNQTSYFAHWYEQKMQLHFQGDATFCLTYQKKDQKFCSLSLQFGKLEAFLVTSSK